MVHNFVDTKSQVEWLLSNSSEADNYKYVLAVKFVVEKITAAINQDMGDKPDPESVERMMHKLASLLESGKLAPFIDEVKGLILPEQPNSLNQVATEYLTKSRKEYIKPSSTQVFAINNKEWITETPFEYASKAITDIRKEAASCKNMQRHDVKWFAWDGKDIENTKEERIGSMEELALAASCSTNARDYDTSYGKAMWYVAGKIGQTLKEGIERNGVNTLSIHEKNNLASTLGSLLNAQETQFFIKQVENGFEQRGTPDLPLPRGIQNDSANAARGFALDTQRSRAQESTWVEKQQQRANEEGSHKGKEK